MATMDIARRHGPGRGYIPIAGQRAGIFQPLQFLSPPLTRSVAQAIFCAVADERARGTARNKHGVLKKA